MILGGGAEAWCDPAFACLSLKSPGFVFLFFNFISKPQSLGSETPASWGQKRLVETPTSWKGVLTWWLVGGAGLSYPFSCSKLNYHMSESVWAYTI